MSDCPVCGGPGVPLGEFGSLLWVRCRDCGLDHSINVKEAE